MSRLVRGLMILVCVAVAEFAGATAHARASDPPTLRYAKLAMHLQAPQTKLQCTAAAPTTVGCGTNSRLVVVGYPGVTYHLYLLVADLDPEVGLLGAEFSIRYDGNPLQGVDVLDWSTCSELEFPSRGWPDSFGQNDLIFSHVNCQRQLDPSNPTTAVAILGVLTVHAYSDDWLEYGSVQTDSGWGLNIVDCNESVTQVAQSDHERIRNTAYVGFGRYGVDPCGGVVPAPVEPTTWGRVKRMTPPASNR